MVFFDFFRKNRRPSEKLSVQTPDPPVTSDSGFKRASIMDTSLASRCKYHYTDVKCIKLNSSHPKFRAGTIVGLLNDGGHSDPEILAIIFDSTLSLGYVAIGIVDQPRLRSMVSDWIQRDWFLGAQISKIDDRYVYLDIIMGDFPSDDA